MSKENKIAVGIDQIAYITQAFKLMIDYRIAVTEFKGDDGEPDYLSAQKISDDGDVERDNDITIKDFPTKYIAAAYAVHALADELKLAPSDIETPGL